MYTHKPQILAFPFDIRRVISGRRNGESAIIIGSNKFQSRPLKGRRCLLSIMIIGLAACNWTRCMYVRYLRAAVRRCGGFEIQLGSALARCMDAPLLSALISVMLLGYNLNAL